MNQFKTYYPYHSPFDPCPPLTPKVYNTPPELYLTYQPMNLPQFSPMEALKKGTLWPSLYSLTRANRIRRGGGRPCGTKFHPLPRT